jgi:hypothetical protein
MISQELRAIVASLRKQLEDRVGPRVSLNELIGESYAKELAGMKEAEAIQHLRSVDGLKLLHAYSVFSIRANYSLRANHPVLAEVCLKFMASSKISDRILGAGEIGLWLEGTRDKQASHALALMVRNTQETDEVRMEAYSSLELINNRITALDSLRRNMKATGSQFDLLKEIDWNFIDLFL